MQSIVIYKHLHGVVLKIKNRGNFMVSNFFSVANLPAFGYSRPDWTLDSLIRFNKETYHYEKVVNVWNENCQKMEPVELKAIFPPANVIRYTAEWIKHDSGYSGGRKDEVNIGNNWQTLALVRDLYSVINMKNPPTSQDELTSNHFALAILRNKFDALSLGGTSSVVRVPVSGDTSKLESWVASDTIEHKKQLLFSATNIGITVGSELESAVLFGQISSEVAFIASNFVWMESFFSPANIDKMVDDIAEMAGPDVDKEFLRDTIIRLGENQREIFDEQLSARFANYAQKEAEGTYNLFVPGYDVTNSANFKEYKQEIIRLMEDMFLKAVDEHLFGDARKSVNSLWNAVWTDDRIFNIAGQKYNMREMDDRRTFLIYGEDRLNKSSEDNSIKAAAEVKSEQDVRLSLRKELKDMFVRRFANHQNVFDEYEKYLG